MTPAFRTSASWRHPRMSCASFRCRIAPPTPRGKRARPYIACCTAPTTACSSSSGPAPSTIRRPRSTMPRASRPCAANSPTTSIIVMRVYFEKPRTTVGWKGLINDPRLDDSFRINEGLRLARRMLLRDQRARPARGHRVSRHDLAAVHRRPDRLGRDRRAHHRSAGPPRAGLRALLPVGFKNGTDGDIKIAVDAIKAAGRRTISCRSPRPAMSAIVDTAGNEDCHVILRGGKKPNYDAASVEAACAGAGRGGARRTPDDRLLPRQRRQASISGRSRWRRRRRARSPAATRASSG